MSIKSIHASQESPDLWSHFSAVLDEEDCVKHCQESPSHSEGKVAHEPELVLDGAADAHPREEPDREETVEKGQPFCPSGASRDITDVGVASEEETNITSRAVLQALEQEVLGLQLVEVGDVDHEDSIIEDVTETGPDDQELKKEAHMKNIYS